LTATRPLSRNRDGQVLLDTKRIKEESALPYADHDGIHIHYEVEGTGPPLVLQHGFTGNLKRWHQFGYVEALKPNYRVILIDARGHGESDKPHDAAAYALPLRVGDVLAVLDSLNLDKAHYWGYSMGGWIGFGMAKYAHERVHSLIIGGAHPYELRLPASSRLDGSDPDAFVAALFGRLNVNAAALPPGLREELFANDFRALAAAQQDRTSLEDVLPTMTMPCCLYASDADPLYPKAQECVQRIPHATFFTLQGLDHSAAFRAAGLALPRVTEFLQGVTEATQQSPKAMRVL
jgi:pimeloyl-ACP methyl ester carboxylesterase